MRDIKAIKKMIKKKYKNTIWKPFIRALKEFNFIEENDKIAIAFSGGKDSILLSFLFEELKNYSENKFELCYITIDPGIKMEDGSKTDTYKKLNSLSSEMQINLNIYESDMFDFVKSTGIKSPCFLCSKIRRGYLYDKAKELGANKLALGHHMDDVVETILMNMIYQSKYMTMMPVIKSKNFENMKLIRPLYYIEEENIIKWLRSAEINSIQECCPLKDENTGARKEIKNLISSLNVDFKDFKKNIQKSAHNVCLDAIVNTRKDS